MDRNSPLADIARLEAVSVLDIINSLVNRPRTHVGSQKNYRQMLARKYETRVRSYPCLAFSEDHRRLVVMQHWGDGFHGENAAPDTADIGLRVKRIAVVNFIC
jgi:hypothetical protein